MGSVHAKCHTIKLYFKPVSPGNRRFTELYQKEHSRSKSASFKEVLFASTLTRKGTCSDLMLTSHFFFNFSVFMSPPYKNQPFYHAQLILFYKMTFCSIPESQIKANSIFKFIVILSFDNSYYNSCSTFLLKSSRKYFPIFFSHSFTHISRFCTMWIKSFVLRWLCHLTWQRTL